MNEKAHTKAAKPRKSKKPRILRILFNILCENQYTNIHIAGKKKQKDTTEKPKPVSKPKTALKKYTEDHKNEIVPIYFGKDGPNRDRGSNSRQTRICSDILMGHNVRASIYFVRSFATKT